MLELYLFGCFKYYAIAVFYGKPGGVQLCKATSVAYIYIGKGGWGGSIIVIYCFFFFLSNPNLNTMFCYGFHECCKVYFTKLIFRSS